MRRKRLSFLVVTLLAVMAGFLLLAKERKDLPLYLPVGSKISRSASATVETYSGADVRSVWARLKKSLKARGGSSSWKSVSRRFCDTARLPDGTEFEGPCLLFEVNPLRLRPLDPPYEPSIIVRRAPEPVFGVLKRIWPF